jgi:hypothetical protein
MSERRTDKPRTTAPPAPTVSHQWTLFAEAFPASRTPSLADAADLTTHAISGPSSHESFATYDPAGCWLKTSQGYCQMTLDGASERFSETWPSAGMTRNGIAYLHGSLVPHIDESACGWLPTPGANDFKGSHRYGQRTGQLDEFAENLPDWIPCSCCEDYLCVIHWPLHAYECDCPALGEESNVRSTMDPYSAATRGHLSPALSEWLMGFPIAWTDCARSATRSCRRSPNGSDDE